MRTNKMVIKGNLYVDQINKAFESDPPLIYRERVFAKSHLEC